MNFIKKEGLTLAYKFSKAVMINFQKESGKDLTKDAEGMSLMDNMTLAYLAIKHGCKAEGIVFDYTLDEFLDLDTKYDIVDEMNTTLTQEQGK